MGRAFVFIKSCPPPGRGGPDVVTEDWGRGLECRPVSGGGGLCLCPPSYSNFIEKFLLDVILF